MCISSCSSYYLHKTYHDVIEVVGYFTDVTFFVTLSNTSLSLICTISQLEGRKISVQHFLKIMSTLRPWEICYPEIAAAIEVG
jgi:hypothetical protein